MPGQLDQARFSASAFTTAAGARPPQPAGSFAPWPSFSAPPPSIVGPHLLVTRLSSAPTRARAGHGYLLHGFVVNKGSAAARGKLGCVTAERHLEIGSARRVGPVRVPAASSEVCSPGAHSLSPFGAHVYVHQWWGDNVSEANYNLTFFKEGLATYGEYLFIAANARAAAGGSEAAFEQSLVAPVQHRVRGHGSHVDGRAVGSASVHAFLGLEDLQAAGHRVHRVAPDPRPGELQRCAAADSGRVPVGEHHRGAAQIDVRVVPARAVRVLHRGARPILHRVVGHRLSARRWREQTADHRARTRRRRLPLLIAGRNGEIRGAAPAAPSAIRCRPIPGSPPAGFVVEAPNDADDSRSLGRRASRLTCRLRARRLPHREEVGTATPCSRGDTRATSFVAALAAERSRGPRWGALESSRSRSERRRT
jgi:hypothetical protein